MKKVAISAVVLLVLCVAPAVGQQTGNNSGQGPSKYWLTPGQTDHDGKGNVTYTEIKDPKTFTTKVFSHGQWLMYHYRPNTTDILSIDSPDSTDNFLYDNTGKWNGVSVRVGGKTHTLRYDRDKGTVAAAGMPVVTVEKDPNSVATRDLVVRRGTEIVASANYAISGEVRSLNVGAMTLSFILTDKGVKETLRVNGTTLKEAITRGGGRRFFHVLLDPVADQLGIEKDWVNHVQSKTNATGYMTSIQQGPAVVARFVDLGGMRVAFDSNAAPLFYDIDFNYGAYGGKDPQTGLSGTAAYTAALPTHIIVTADGNVGAYVEFPGDGAIRAFWAKIDKKGQPTYMYSVYDAGAPTHASSLSAKPNVAPAQSGTAAGGRSRGVMPLAMMICDSSFICSYSDGCPSCGGCETTYYWCDPGSGGGITQPPDGSGSSGGGTGGQPSPGNHVYDPTTRQAVDRAIGAVNDKLSNTQCSETLLKDVTMPDGTQMWAILQQKGMSSAEWFGNVGWYFGDGVRNDSNQVPCSAASAWTLAGSTKVYVCSVFKNLRSTSVQGDTLIHEMLHTLGLPECNSFSSVCPAGYMTPWQIEQAVEDHCGS